MRIANETSAPVEWYDGGNASDLGGIRSMTVEKAGEQALNAMGYLRFKFVAEWVAAFLLSVILLPVFLLLVILVKLTSTGPALYLQLRLGQGGRRFWIYKLRTMVHQCEARTGPVWSGANDPRVTPVGRWLRDTHLDEIPQLLNVLRGEMALIGPRPERPEIAARIERTLPDFKNRLLVRPGITGLAQIRMPADTDLYAVKRKLMHDSYYIRHLNLAMDARVMMATVLHFFIVVASKLCRHLIQSRIPSVDERLPLIDGENTSPNSRINVVHALVA